MTKAPDPTDPRIRFVAAVDRLLEAAEKAREERDRLLRSIRGEGEQLTKPTEVAK